MQILLLQTKLKLYALPFFLVSDDNLTNGKINKITQNSTPTKKLPLDCERLCSYYDQVEKKMLNLHQIFFLKKGNKWNRLKSDHYI